MKDDIPDPIMQSSIIYVHIRKCANCTAYAVIECMYSTLRAIF